MASTLFSIPVTPRHTSSKASRTSSTGKRKRGADRVGQETTDGSVSASQPAGQQQEVPEEYSAVISPDERAQRIAAGASLLGHLPPSPFPHAAAKGDDERRRKPYAQSNAQDPDSAPTSLRNQHLAAMTAVLHKCLQKKDYDRASRALGLLLRTDLGGHPIDIRACGYWNIGAEILLRRGVQNQKATPTLPFTEKSFEQAKTFYENLIIQHPYHKPLPDAINAIDFYLAMLSLWIYVAQAQASFEEKELDTDNPGQDPSDELSALQEVRLRQVRRVDEIASRMDQCMSSAPYGDNAALLRIRAMLALWHAELYEACVDLTQTAATTEATDLASVVPEVTGGIRNTQSLEDDLQNAAHYRDAAQRARQLATRTFGRLGIDDEEDD